MDELREIVQKAVERYRMRDGKGMTQTQVSKKIGMSASYLAVLKMEGAEWAMSSEDPREDHQRPRDARD